METLTDILEPLLAKHGLGMGDWRSDRALAISKVPEIYMPDFEKIEQRRTKQGKKSSDYSRIMHTIRYIETKNFQHLCIIPPENHMFPDATSTKTAKKGESLHLRRVRSLDELGEDTNPEKLFRERAHLGRLVEPVVSYDWQGISKSFDDIKVVTPTDLYKAYKLVKKMEVAVMHDYTKAPQSAEQGGIIVAEVKSKSHPDFSYFVTISRVPMKGEGPQCHNYFDIESETHGDCAKKAFAQLHYGRTGRPSERTGDQGRRTKESYMCQHIIAAYLAHLKMNKKYAIAQNPFLIMRKEAVRFYEKLWRVAKVEADEEGRQRVKLFTDVDKNILMMKYFMMRPNSYLFNIIS